MKMVKTDMMKTVAWVMGGTLTTTTLVEKITATTKWGELLTPYHILPFVGTAFMFLAAYWSKSPVPVAGEPATASSDQDHTSLRDRTSKPD